MQPSHAPKSGGTLKKRWRSADPRFSKSSCNKTLRDLVFDTWRKNMIARNLQEVDMSGPKVGKEQSAHQPAGRSSSMSTGHWYSIPQPIRRVFDQFPLVIYNENTLPQRARRQSNKHTLFIFANRFDKSGANLSCNPTCLKWQAYLRFNDVDFSVVASNNHASPSGSLPFLLPASSAAEPTPSPISTGKIQRWTSRQTMQEEDTSKMELEILTALVDQNIRSSWLYHLYLNKANFDAVAHPLYVATASSNRFVQAAIAYQLREAAQYELLKSRHIIDGDEVYHNARKGFRSLSTFLGSNAFFSKTDRPGLFDASVFAYTHLLLDQDLPWVDSTLTEILRECSSLVEYRDRVLKMCTDG